MEKLFEYITGKIHYYDQGRGDAIVLLHGYLETSEVWNCFAKKFSEKFRIISVDLPGHGKSDNYGEVLTMEFIATLIKNLLESLNIKKVFLIGHSLGGYITLAFTELYPDMLSGYCLFHSQPFSDSPETLEKRKREIYLVKEGNKDLMIADNISRMFATSNLQKFSDAFKKLKGAALSIKGEGIIAVLKGMIARPSRLSVMESGKVPCLWILGSMDNYINCEQIQTKVKLPANAKVVILKESGHIGFVEEEEKSVEIITEFVRKCT
jgi:pimeloyl-ACP methyl ester carboxylesterase